MFGFVKVSTVLNKIDSDIRYYEHMMMNLHKMSKGVFTNPEEQKQVIEAYKENELRLTEARRIRFKLAGLK